MHFLQSGLTKTGIYEAPLEQDRNSIIEKANDPDNLTNTELYDLAFLEGYMAAIREAINRFCVKHIEG